MPRLMIEDRTTKRHNDEPCPGLSPEDRRHYQSFDEKLQLVRDRTEGVAKGYSNGAYIFGEGGIGKTYSVVRELQRLQAPYRLTNSRVTGRGLFDLLELDPEAVHVLDDVESVVEDKKALGVLRSALWSQAPRDRHGRQERRVTWVTNNKKASFVFVGGIIMIGNRSPGNFPELRALVTRIPPIQLQASDREIRAMMRHIAQKGYRHGDHELDPSECLEVVEFIIAQSHDLDFPLDLRLVENGFADYLQFDEHDSGTHWKDLVASRLRRRPTSFEEVEPLGVRAADMARELAAAREVVDLPKDKRFDAWRKLTGMSRGTMYRRFQDLAREDSQFFYK